MIWDILVIVTIILSAVIAFFRGFIREILTIIGVVGGLAGAYFLGPKLIPIFRSMFGVGENAEDGEGKEAKLFDLIPYELIADGLAYGSIFLIIVIVLSIISHFLASATKKSGLNVVDRSLGVLFGVLRGVVLLGLIYLPIHVFVEAESKKEWFADSRSIIYIELTADALAELFPEFEEEPEKMFSTKEVEKAIKARKLMNDLEGESEMVTPEAPDQETKPEEKDVEGASGEQGYEKKLRQEMKNILSDPPGEPVEVPENE